MNSLQYLAKEILEVARPLEIISLRILRACVFHEWVEAEFGDGDAGGAEGIPYVALMLAEVLRGEVCVGVALFAVDSAVSLDVGGEGVGGVKGVGYVCCASFDVVGWGGSELSCVGVEVEEVHRVVYVQEVGRGEAG